MKHLDLFSGIGGFALATEMVWDNVEHVFCDNEPFSQAVLKKHWPNSIIYGDIRTLTADTERQRLSSEQIPRGAQSTARPSKCAQDVYILTGGFPCQPFSQAGRRRGTEDDRHLWPEMLRVIREFHPRWVIGENVGGLVTWDGGVVLEQIHLDLESEGYEVQAFVIPAVSLNAPHRRDRVWIVANGDTRGLRRHERPSAQEGTAARSGDASIGSNTVDSRLEGSSNERSGHYGQSNRKRSNQGTAWSENWPEVAARLCTLDDGLSNGLARPRGWRNAALKGAGNAIVPQVAAEIMFAISHIESFPQHE